MLLSNARFRTVKLVAAYIKPFQSRAEQRVIYLFYCLGVSCLPALSTPKPLETEPILTILIFAESWALVTKDKQ